jgi:stress-induced morphogen
MIAVVRKNPNCRRPHPHTTPTPHTMTPRPLLLLPLRLSLRTTLKRTQSTMSQTPLEDTIRRKLIAGLNPRTLQIHNDSHKHAHHAPMRGVTSRETHFRFVYLPSPPLPFLRSFTQRYSSSRLGYIQEKNICRANAKWRARLIISSPAFSGKPQIQRHRAVNELLKEELQREGGIHALQLRTMTLEEEEKLWEKAREIEENERKMKDEGTGCEGACERKQEGA